MSEYEFHEFCRIEKPMTASLITQMSKLSSRANVGTHTASYEYNYSTFKGDPEKILLKNFDVYYHVTNFGHARLMFKYPLGEVDIKELKSHKCKYIVDCTKKGKYVLIDINFSSQEAGGWADGNGWLSKILPIYEEIKNGDYRIFHIAQAINDEIDCELKMLPKTKISKAQKALLRSMNYSNL